MPTKKPEKRTHYAEALNNTFKNLRSLAAKEALKSICGAGGLCHHPQICSVPEIFAFFAWLCQDPSFFSLPCAQSAQQVWQINKENGTFLPTHTAQRISFADYLENSLSSSRLPLYLSYIIAKIITQAPENTLPEMGGLLQKSCQAHPKLCKIPRAPTVQ